MQETEDPLEKGMATHWSSLDLENPKDRGPWWATYSPWGHTESDTTDDPWVGKIVWRRKWQPTPAFLPGKSHRQRSLVGYSLWGCKRVGHDLATKQQQMYV